MVYQNGELLDLGTNSLAEYGKEAKGLIFGILTGMAEINSVGYGFGNIDDLLLVKTRLGNMDAFWEFKIFDLSRVVPFGSKIKIFPETSGLRRV